MGHGLNPTLILIILFINHIYNQMCIRKVSNSEKKSNRRARAILKKVL